MTQKMTPFWRGVYEYLCTILFICIYTLQSKKKGYGPEAKKKDTGDKFLVRFGMHFWISHNFYYRKI